MSKAKKEIEELINKRVQKNQQLKSEAVDKNTVEQIVYEFVQRYEEIIKIDPSKNSHGIRAVVRPAVDILKGRIRQLDPLARVDFGIEYPEGQSRLESVKIFWSDKFAKENNVSQEQVVSVADLLLRFCMQDN